MSDIKLFDPTSTKCAECGAADKCRRMTAKLRSSGTDQERDAIITDIINDVEKMLLPSNDEMERIRSYGVLLKAEVKRLLVNIKDDDHSVGVMVRNDFAGVRILASDVQRFLGPRYDEHARVLGWKPMLMGGVSFYEKMAVPKG